MKSLVHFVWSKIQKLSMAWSMETLKYRKIAFDYLCTDNHNSDYHADEESGSLQRTGKDQTGHIEMGHVESLSKHKDNQVSKEHNESQVSSSQ